MPVRRAACDPCRSSKVACDNARPVCQRCQTCGKETDCVYRAQPFKKRRITTAENQTSSDNVIEQHEVDTTGATAPQKASRLYPNPGYLGDASHMTVFERLTVTDEHDPADRSSVTNSSAFHRIGLVANDARIRSAAALIEDLLVTIPISLCYDAVKKWLAKGSNVATAGLLIEPCSTAAYLILSDKIVTSIELATRMYTSTCRTLVVSASTSLQEYEAQFCGDNVRLETIGLFLVAIIHALAVRVELGPSLRSRRDRQRVQNHALRLADQFLEHALSLDCLNDLQLALQYEDWIGHSLLDGDQSYFSWRKLGDVISSISALGYHEQVADLRHCPAFLIHLRTIVTARIYSADKNVSLFLGRPPRMHRSYCRVSGLIDQIVLSRQILSSSQSHNSSLSNDAAFDYSLDTQWAAACAVLKEKILDLARKDWPPSSTSSIDDVLAEAGILWNSLPEKYRFTRAPRLSDNLTAIELDFVISTRLNYLHILFLLRRQNSHNVLEPEDAWAVIAQEMLHLAATAVVLQEEILSSGTSLAWKIVYYGLSAAGVACLFLLNRGSTGFDHASIHGINVQKIIQDLSVLVVHSDAGTLIAADEPNHAVLNKAIVTIRSVIGRALAPQQRDPVHQGRKSPQPQHTSMLPDFEDWISKTADSTAWEFDPMFWQHLADHPDLTEQIITPI